jgi:hypothetical protein
MGKFPLGRCPKGTGLWKLHDWKDELKRQYWQIQMSQSDDIRYGNIRCCKNCGKRVQYVERYIGMGMQTEVICQYPDGKYGERHEMVRQYSGEWVEIENEEKRKDKELRARAKIP